MRRRLRNGQPLEHFTLLITDSQRRAGCTHMPPYHKHQLFTRHYTSFAKDARQQPTPLVKRYTDAVSRAASDLGRRQERIEVLEFVLQDVFAAV